MILPLPLATRLRRCVVPLLVVLCGLASAPPALAATYKCELGGRVEYQDRPCAADAATGGRESRIDAATPPARSTGATAPASAATHAGGVAGSRGAAAAGPALSTKAGVPPGTDPEAFARRAFDRMKSGNLDLWAEALCPERRAALQQQSEREAFRRASLNLAAKGTTLAGIRHLDGNAVTINATELVSGRPRSAMRPSSTFVVGIGDDRGRACVLGTSYY